MRTVAIIQARMGSTRLPGKVLMNLPGGTVLSHVIERVRNAGRVSETVIATTTAKSDDAIVEECNRLGVPCFRGSEKDVLARYHGAAKQFQADLVVRVTSDCPLFDGSLLDRMLQRFDADYMSNTLRRRFPRGLDAEMFTFAALDRAFREASSPHQREHVTPYLYEHPELFHLQSYEEEPDRSQHRWTLDTVEDWKFIEAVFGELYRPNHSFSTADVLNLLQRRPELAKINSAVTQKALAADAKT
jgi:spore coat polysaccharide biosynthesis protein SpsF